MGDTARGVGVILLLELQKLMIPDLHSVGEVGEVKTEFRNVIRTMVKIEVMIDI